MVMRSLKSLLTVVVVAASIPIGAGIALAALPVTFSGHD
jgi:hypothetical protein